MELMTKKDISGGFYFLKTSDPKLIAVAGLFYFLGRYSCDPHKSLRREFIPVQACFTFRLSMII
jgi:hypothetical protein